MKFKIDRKEFSHKLSWTLFRKTKSSWVYRVYGFVMKNICMHVKTIQFVLSFVIFSLLLVSKMDDSQLIRYQLLLNHDDRFSDVKEGLAKFYPGVSRDNILLAEIMNAQIRVSSILTRLNWRYYQCALFIFMLAMKVLSLQL